MTRPAVWHVRVIEKRHGRNPYYKSVRVLRNETLCGAEMTAYDVGLSDAKRHPEYVNCEECRRRLGGE